MPVDTVERGLVWPAHTAFLDASGMRLLDKTFYDPVFTHRYRTELGLLGVERIFIPGDTDAPH